MLDAADIAPIRPEVVDALDRALPRIAATGTWWTGAERVAIASVAREARRHGARPDTDLPAAAVQVAEVVGRRPQDPTEAWVTEMVEALGEESYVEAVGVASRVVAVDTFRRLLGLEPEPLPEPVPGEPDRVRPDDLRKGRTWVSMPQFAPPPLVLGAVPREVEDQNDLSDVIYMTGEEMADDDFSRRGLHRTQIETVAATTSHANECFY